MLCGFSMMNFGGVLRSDCTIEVTSSGASVDQRDRWKQKSAQVQESQRSGECQSSCSAKVQKSLQTGRVTARELLISIIYTESVQLGVQGPQK
jgi:hypothetical protein